MKQQSNINSTKPKKSLGQNFITDDLFVKKISNQIKSDKNTIIIEIGPGRGALTKYLIKKNLKSLLLIEKDRQLSLYLREIYKNDKRVQVKNMDALNVKYNELNLEGKVIIVGNLPFNISTQLLYKWLDIEKWPPFYNRMILMFQKEVADRIMSKHNNKNYGKISVVSQTRCEVKKLFDAPPNIFTPIPKVYGAMLDFKPSLKYKNLNLIKLKKILSVAFSARRKKIKTNLKSYKHSLEMLNIDENLRAENLSVYDYCRLTDIS